MNTFKILSKLFKMFPAGQPEIQIRVDHHGMVGTEYIITLILYGRRNSFMITREFLDGAANVDKIVEDQIDRMVERLKIK